MKSNIKILLYKEDGKECMEILPTQGYRMLQGPQDQDHEYCLKNVEWRLNNSKGWIIQWVQTRFINSDTYAITHHYYTCSHYL